MMHACRIRLATAAAAAASATAASMRLHAASSIMAPVPIVRLQPRPFSRAVAAAAADAASSASDGTSVTDRLKADMKAAMKAKNQTRLDAIRFLQAAIKQKEIELRESSQTLGDAEIIKVIQKMAKQRQDSIDSYRQGGREDLVEKEEQELQLLRSYLPAMLSPSELQALVDVAVAEAGATSVKQMGAVIKLVQAKSGGRADSKAISDLVKAKLQK